MCQKKYPRMTDSKIKHLLNDVIGHSLMYHKQYHIYCDKLQLFGYKKKIWLEEQNCWKVIDTVFFQYNQFGTSKPRFFFHYPTPSFCQTVPLN